MNALELWPVLAGPHPWYRLMKDSVGRIVTGKDSIGRIVTGNLQVYYMIRTSRSRNHSCMYWLRELIWICRIFYINKI